MKYKKGEFTTVPNKSMRSGLAPKLQVIYMWLCDYSDDNFESYPSRSTLAKNCGVSVRALDDGIGKLIELGMISKETRVVNNEYTSSLYTVNILTPPSAESAQPSAENDTTPSADSAHRTQPITNSTHLTQSTNVDGQMSDRDEYGRRNEINEMFEYWQSTVGYAISSRIQANRYACKNLLAKYKASGVKQLIDATAIAQSDQYAPRISDFSSMQSKLNDLIAWGKKKGQNNAAARF